MTFSIRPAAHRFAPRSALAVLLLSTPALAAELEVTVTGPEGKVLAGATCSIPELRRQTTADAQGVCRFDGLAEGRYHVSAWLDRLAAPRQEVEVSGAGAATVALQLAAQPHFSESMTVSPQGSDTFESYQPTTVLGGEDLQQRLGATLGATLASEPGVNVRSFGAGNERPVIRGLDNDRVLILENGARTGDLSSQSADHGVNLDPATTGRIEVVRGPATLLYGGSAIGGVVNLISYPPAR
jgi:iron complex outermembrane receptor protein